MLLEAAFSSNKESGIAKEWERKTTASTSKIRVDYLWRLETLKMAWIEEEVRTDFPKGG